MEKDETVIKNILFREIVKSRVLKISAKDLVRDIGNEAKRMSLDPKAIKNVLAYECLRIFKEFIDELKKD